MKKQGQYLLVRPSQSENTYGAFAQEILRAEGLMGFVPVDLGRALLPELQPGDIVLVTRCFLTRQESAGLLEAAAAGVSLAFLQPQLSLVEQAGGRPACRVINPGYLRVSAGFPGGGEVIQTHVPINCVNEPVTGDSWTVPATAITSDKKESGFSAVAGLEYGRGRIAFFFYDLAEAVARIRFGNPALASYVTLGEKWTWPHAGDLFAGHLDPDCADLPQADIHGQLLAKVLTDLSAAPLGRFWYYEDGGQRSSAVLESDEDGASPAQIETIASVVEQYHGSDTFYLMRDSTKMSRAQVDALRARGHTFGPHVNPRGRPEELYFAVPAAVQEETGEFTERFGAPSRTLQCHCAPWLGYMSQVPQQVRSGYRLLFAYLSVPKRNWARYMCGSGRPMKFFDNDGLLHDCWQQPVTIMDDSTLAEKLGSEPEASLREFETKLQAALQSNHTSFAILSHPTAFCTFSRRVMEGCFSRFAADGVPIYNGDRWCDFLDRRWAVRLEQGVGRDEHLMYIVSNLSGRLPLMIPLRNGKVGENWSVEVNGARALFTIYRRLEESYLFVELEGVDPDSSIRVVIRRT